MAHFALVCPPMHGHMNPMFSVARELARRGHRVSVAALADAAPRARAAGLDFHPVGEREFPPGSIAERTRELGRLRGLAGLRYTIGIIRRENAQQLDELPALFRKLSVDATLIDQVCPAGGTASDLAGLPWITVCNALMIEEEPSVPPVVLPWRYGRSAWARMRNRFGHWMLGRALRPIRTDINAFRRRGGLAPMHAGRNFSSPFATVSQAPRSFDFPRERLLPTFHYAGPFVDPSAREAIPFPFDRLDGRPLVYASLGTLQNQIASVFQCIAAACADLPVQLVISLGRDDADSSAAMPGDPIVVPYAPQLELLRRAALTVTHAGLNTVLESLSAGVPMVAIPMTNDQPGVAARLEFHGAGRVVAPKRLTVARLRDAIAAVLAERSYRDNAQALAQDIAATPGVRLAADLAERVQATRQPVPSC